MCYDEKDKLWKTQHLAIHKKLSNLIKNSVQSFSTNIDVNQLP